MTDPVLAHEAPVNDGAARPFAIEDLGRPRPRTWLASDQVVTTLPCFAPRPCAGIVLATLRIPTERGAGSSLGVRLGPLEFYSGHDATMRPCSVGIATGRPMRRPIGRSMGRTVAIAMGRPMGSPIGRPPGRPM